MGKLHDEYNALGSADERKTWIQANVPAEERSKFRDTAKKAKSRAAASPEKTASRRASNAATQLKARTAAVAKNTDEAHALISGELSRTPNPVKVEYRPTKDTWTSRFVPPSMVPDLAASHPGADMSFTFTDSNGTARTYNTTRPGAAHTVPAAGHATGGRVLVGRTSSNDLVTRIANGLPAESVVTRQTAGYGHAPFGVTPDIADRYLQNQAEQRSAQEVAKARAIPEPHPPQGLVELNQLGSEAASMAMHPTERFVRRAHAARMKSDPKYAGEVTRAATEKAARDTAIASATNRLENTIRSASTRSVDQQEVQPHGSPDLNTRLTELMEHSGSGYSVNDTAGAGSTRDPGGPAMKDYVYPRSITPQDRQMSATYNLATGVSEGDPEHLRRAEHALIGGDWESVRDVPDSRPDFTHPLWGDTKVPPAVRMDQYNRLSAAIQGHLDEAEESRLQEYGKQVEQDIRLGTSVRPAAMGDRKPSGVTREDWNRQVTRRVEAAVESERGRARQTRQDATDLAKMYWQMGTHPMYRSVMQDPGRIGEAVTALGGRETGTLPEQAEAMGERIQQHEHERRMTDVIGYPAEEWQAIAKANPGIPGAAPPSTGEVSPLRQRHEALRGMVRADLLGTIQASARERGLLDPRAQEGARVQEANDPAEAAIEGARTATDRRSRK